MNSSKRFKYLRNNGTFSEVYSIDNPPPTSTVNMNWRELWFEENANGLAYKMNTTLYGGTFTSNSIYAVVLHVYGRDVIVTASNVGKFDPYSLVFSFSLGNENCQTGEIGLYFENENSLRFDFLGGASYSNSGSWSQIDTKQVFIKGLFKLVLN